MPARTTVTNTTLLTASSTTIVITIVREKPCKTAVPAQLPQSRVLDGNARSRHQHASSHHGNTISTITSTYTTNTIISMHTMREEPCKTAFPA